MIDLQALRQLPGCGAAVPVLGFENCSVVHAFALANVGCDACLSLVVAAALSGEPEPEPSDRACIAALAAMLGRDKSDERDEVDAWRKILRAAYAVDRPRVSPGEDPEGGCPCLYVTPCSQHCSCANGIMSGGCTRCCAYGSLAQRKAAAERLAGVPVSPPREEPTPEQVREIARATLRETVNVIRDWAKTRPHDDGADRLVVTQILDRAAQIEGEVEARFSHPKGGQ
jgi:hypothetical protein